MQWALVAAILTVVALGVGAIAYSRRPPQLGPLAGRLRPCPDSPNCVCSFDVDSEHAISPLDTPGDPIETMNRLRSLLESSPGVRITADEGVYLQTEFTTPVLRFIDDVEFLLDETAGVIHVRSAARVGYSDFGVNRRRIESIRQRLSEEGR